MSIVQVLSLVQFARGTNLVWDALATPIPAGVVAFSIDDGVFKLGDGINPYSTLVPLFSFNDLVSAQGGVSGLFVDPVVANNGKIVVVSFNTGTNAVEYSVSNTTLAGLLASIAALEAGNTTQDAAIAQVLAIALSIDVSINTGADNEIVTIVNGRYTGSGMTIAGAQAQVLAGITNVPGSHLEDPIFYTTATKAKVANQMKLLDGYTYYVEVVGFNNTVAAPVYGLSSLNAAAVIANVGDNLFSVRLNDVTLATKIDTPIILVASVDNVAGTSKVQKAVSCKVLRNRIIVSIYGGATDDSFQDVTTDSQDNIICVGNTSSEGLGGSPYGDALIVKYDSNLNILAKKRYGGTGDEILLNVIVDSKDNILCVGWSASEGALKDALIIKFDTNLNTLIKRRYSGSVDDNFYGVTIDSFGNIICVGGTSSEGLGAFECLIVKFDSSLNIIARKRFGGTLNEGFYGVRCDSQNNIYGIGFTSSEGSGVNDALIVKFDTNLNILAKKRYGGTGDDGFHDLTIDSQNNIYCIGYTASEGSGLTDALLIKFDSNLNILAKKRYGGTGNENFYGIKIDSKGNIFCSGMTSSGSFGSYDALIIKFDSNLNVVARKIYGGTADDQFRYMTIDRYDNIICSGYVSSEGAGNKDAVVVKIPAVIPSGSITGTVLTGLTFTDTTGLTLADSNLTLADSNLTLANSALTLATTSISTATSYLTQERDLLN